MLHNIKKIRILLVFALVLSSAVFASACSNDSKTSLAPYVSVVENGLSGEGTATVEVDWAGIKNQILGTVPADSAARDAYYEKAADLERSLSFVLDKTNALSNGDEVTVSIVCSEKASISYNIKMFESFTVKLEGFLKQTRIDLFDGLEVSFEGYSPNVTAVLKNVGKNDFLKAVTFTANKTQNLVLGDEILVTATYSEDFAESLGYTPISTTKTYTVQEVAYYPYSYAELPTDLVKSLATTSLVQINNRWENYQTVILSVLGDSIDRQSYLNSKVSDIQIRDPMLLEIIVLTRKDITGSWFGSYNYVFFVYKTIVNDSVLCAETEIYQCVVYSDLFVNEYGVPTYSQWNTEKPQYEISSLEELTAILQEEYIAYDSEVILK